MIFLLCLLAFAFLCDPLDGKIVAATLTVAGGFVALALVFAFLFTLT